MSTEHTLNQEIKHKWLQVVAFIEENFQKKPDLNAILFLIGIRELGELPEKAFTKEEKTRLMHIANCRVLSFSGYYEKYRTLEEFLYKDYLKDFNKIKYEFSRIFDFYLGL